MNGWSSSGGFILLEQGVNGITNLAAFDGSQFLTFGHNAAPGGTISQVFQTVVGQQYEITFDFASTQGAAVQTMQSRISDDTSGALIDSIDSSTQALSNTWEQGSILAFIATSNSSRIEFEHTVGNSSANIAFVNDVACFSSTGSHGTPFPLIVFNHLSAGFIQDRALIYITCARSTCAGECLDKN